MGRGALLQIVLDTLCCILVVALVHDLQHIIECRGHRPEATMETTAPLSIDLVVRISQSNGAGNGAATLKAWSVRGPNYRKAICFSRETGALSSSSSGVPRLVMGRNCETRQRDDVIPVCVEGSAAEGAQQV